jgi:protein-L-isoaspartate(D-aspartate) O-methyltransferase
MGTDSIMQERENMVELQLQRRNITDERILEAFRNVPRHEFVPDEHQDAAYSDNPIPIGYGQTISQPYVVALMIQEVGVNPNDVVLDIGSGSGYSSAILSHLADEVYGIERIEPLAIRSEETLNSLGYDNVEIKCGDGFEGWPEKAPFDVIMIGAAPETIPEKLKNQMADGGRFIGPIGGFDQRLMILRKKDGNIEKEEGTMVRFVPMKHGTQTEEEAS